MLNITEEQQKQATHMKMNQCARASLAILQTREVPDGINGR
jgi:hypothetical protein